MSSKSVRQKAAMAPSTAVKAPLGESSLNRPLDAPSASAKRTGAEPATPGLTLVGAATVDAAADGTPEEVRESASYLGDASAIRGDSLEKTTPAQTPVQNGQQQQAGILATPLTGASTMSAMTTTTTPSSTIFAKMRSWISRRAPQLANYTITETDDSCIGVGQATTRVYSGVDKTTGERCAVKVVTKKSMTKAKIAEVRREGRVMRELQALPHPNLVRMKDGFEDRRNIYIIMELMEGGELFDQIAQRGSFTEYEAYQVMQQVADGLHHLHSHGYMHRDLKPENLLCHKKDSLELIKICDFGMTKFLGQKNAGTPCGTVTYVAPEVVLNKGEDPNTREGYNIKADVWSLGVILYILLSGRPPFYDDTPQGVLMRIRAADYDFPATEWDYVSKEAKDLIGHCLTLNPKLRYDIPQFMKHPWFALMAKGPSTTAPKLMSPVILRNSSIPLNDFVRLLDPIAQKAATSMPEPVYWPHQTRTQDSKPFMKWKVGEPPTDFEVPHYYRNLRAVRFGLAGGPGMSCVAWHSEMECEVAVRKAGRVVNDRELSYKMQREIAILQALRHENITTLIDGFISPTENLYDRGVNMRRYLVTEVHEMSLRELLINRPTLDLEDIRLMACHLLRGLNYIHAAGVIHRDLKPWTLFVNLSFDEKICALKIGDFTKASLRAEEYRDSDTQARYYRAPEILLGAPTYDQSVDLWSAGCIVAELLLHHPLFHGARERELLEDMVQVVGTFSESLLTDVYKMDKATTTVYATIKPKQAVEWAKRFVDMPAAAVDFVHRFIVYDPSKRMTAKAALSHPFLASLKQSTVEATPAEALAKDFDVRQTGVHWRDQLEALLARLPAACLDPPVLDLGSDDDDEDADEAVAPAATSAADEDDGASSSDEDHRDAASFRSVQSLASGDSLFSPVVPARHRQNA